MVHRDPVRAADEVRLVPGRRQRAPIEVEELVPGRVRRTDVGGPGRASIEVQDTGAVAAVVVQVDPPVGHPEGGVIGHRHDRGLPARAAEAHIEGQVRPGVGPAVVHLHGSAQQVDDAGLAGSAVRPARQEVVGGLDRPTPHLQHAVATATGTNTKLRQFKVTIVQPIVPEASRALSDHEIINAGRGVNIHHTAVLIHRSSPSVIT